MYKAVCLGVNRVLVAYGEARFSDAMYFKEVECGQDEEWEGIATEEGGPL